MGIKEIYMFDVEINFKVRKGSYGATSIKELQETIKKGLCCNDMECVEAEDISVIIK